MPVYNGEKYLKEAIESILSQSYTDFEFLIINDGSTDNSVKIIKSFSDNRIHLIDNEKNLGQPESYNKGINLACGEYIAIMHSDDFSLPDRIKKQVEFMDANPSIGISGTWVKIVQNDMSEICKLPIDPDLVKIHLLSYCPLFHPSVIMRKKLLTRNNLFYDPSYNSAEDYELWVRASKYLKIANLDEILLAYRIHPEQVSNKYACKQNKHFELIRENMLEQLGVITIGNENIARIQNENVCLHSKESLLKAKVWLEELNLANINKKVFNIPLFSEYLAERWFQVCTNASQFGFWTYKTYYSSELSRLSQNGFEIKAKFFIKCLIRDNKTSVSC